MENGAWAGFISAWSVSSVLLVVELAYGMQGGLFYSVVGISLGVTGNPINSALAGFLLHILTGTLTGMAGGFAIAVCRVLNVSRMVKGIAVGVSVGMTAWVVLFLPITTLVVLPALDKILVPSADNSRAYAIASQATGLSSLVVVGSIIFHALYGLVYGIMMTLLMRSKSREQLTSVTR